MCSDYEKVQDTKPASLSHYCHGESLFLDIMQNVQIMTGHFTLELKFSVITCTLCKD